MEQFFYCKIPTAPILTYLFQYAIGCMITFVLHKQFVLKDNIDIKNTMNFIRLKVLFKRKKHVKEIQFECLSKS